MPARGSQGSQGSCQVELVVLGSLLWVEFGKQGNQTLVVEVGGNLLGVEPGNQGNQLWVVTGNPDNHKGVEPGIPLGRQGFVEEGKQQAEVGMGWEVLMTVDPASDTRTCDV